ncbi:uncharacterized protein F5147DRAFT_781255 [Suillus discolor]|uniref:Uncharacterized protein n=1 Tax=Suillus discolor TaxID=1912936 RepID=A0A9P7JLT6_9AGAM|nr:uncharacterized protein F5147DRAFT_781255 [Suillus discolor]KAG2087610.1 hypothetical protein F5147DRAFT_781255 [Suillus discolor]
MNPPDLLFGLSGFTTLDAATVLQAIQETWAQDKTYNRIESFFSKCGLPDDEMIYKATRDFIVSCRAETLNFKLPGGLSVPCFNIFATSPTNDAKTWTDLRLYLSSLIYPTNLDGCGVATALFACQICHSLTHPRGLCPFPLTPNWNGPKEEVEVADRGEAPNKILPSIQVYNLTNALHMQPRTTTTITYTSPSSVFALDRAHTSYNPTYPAFLVNTQ